MKRFYFQSEEKITEWKKKCRLAILFYLCPSRSKGTERGDTTQEKLIFEPVLLAVGTMSESYCTFLHHYC